MTNRNYSSPSPGSNQPSGGGVPMSRSAGVEFSTRAGGDARPERPDGRLGGKVPHRRGLVKGAHGDRRRWAQAGTGENGPAQDIPSGPSKQCHLEPTSPIVPHGLSRNRDGGPALMGSQAGQDCPRSRFNPEPYDRPRLGVARRSRVATVPATPTAPAVRKPVAYPPCRITGPRTHALTAIPR